jgi:hypothetical protein
VELGAVPSLHAMEGRGEQGVFPPGISKTFVDSAKQANQDGTRRLWSVYNYDMGDLRGRSWLIGFMTGGGDQGDFAKRSAHPKPPRESINWGNPKSIAMVKKNMLGLLVTRGGGPGPASATERGSSSRDGLLPEKQHEAQEDWAMEVYTGKAIDEAEGKIEEDMLELDLDEEAATEGSKFLGIVVYYSRKSFNPQIVFSDMMQAWSIQKLASVEKIGDYIFKVEFVKEKIEEKGCGGWPLEA